MSPFSQPLALGDVAVWSQTPTISLGAFLDSKDRYPTESQLALLPRILIFVGPTCYLGIYFFNVTAPAK
ncbi:hypothetical protein C8J56DRAFT_1062047 [Mycena floridula]|nr:hypothetical protein C8J56DRAFT_1062047 [Mycena floridula]